MKWKEEDLKDSHRLWCFIRFSYKSSFLNASEKAFMWIYKEAISPFYGLVLGYALNYTYTRPSVQWAGHNLPDSLLSVYNGQEARAGHSLSDSLLSVYNSPQASLLIWLVCFCGMFDHRRCGPSMVGQSHKHKGNVFIETPIKKCLMNGYF